MVELKPDPTITILILEMILTTQLHREVFNRTWWVGIDKLMSNKDNMGFVLSLLVQVILDNSLPFCTFEDTEMK